MKKAKLFLLVLLIPALFQVSCKKDEDKPEVPVLVTSDLIDIGQNIATCGGDITSDGGAPVTSRGVCWSTSANPTITNSNTSDGTGTGSFESSITGLMPNTTYFVRAYATNSAGTTYGNEQTFTTLPESLVYQKPSAANRTEIVTIPTGLQAKADVGDDFGAMMAVAYMGLANAISGFSASFMVPDGATIQNKKDGSVVYYWSYGGFSYWMTYSELADKNTWKYEYEFPDYPRFTYIYAEEGKTGKDGNWTIYDPDIPANYIWTYDWSINTSNTFTASLMWRDNDITASTFDVVSNSDKSGSFKYKDAGVLSADILWNADGSGTYWILGDPDPFTGSWTAK
jgi:hypothetical protein